MVEPAQPGLVSILIVTFNSEKTLDACLDSVRQQDYSPLEIIVVDNNSTEDTRRILSASTCQAILNSENRGFAAAQNQAMRAARGEWLLCLNPDVLLGTNFVSALMAERERDPTVGTLCGKLLRWAPGAAEQRTRVIDSTGI